MTVQPPEQPEPVAAVAVKVGDGTAHPRIRAYTIAGITAAAAGLVASLVLLIGRDTSLWPLVAGLFVVSAACFANGVDAHHRHHHELEAAAAAFLQVAAAAVRENITARGGNPADTYEQLIARINALPETEQP